MLCSIVFLPDGSGIIVMDQQGNAALLDMQGTRHSWNVAASAAMGGVEAQLEVLPYKLWAAKSANKKSR